MSDVPDHFDLHMLSERIRNARKESFLSQIELAQLVGVSDKAISSYEVGRAIPPLDILKKISIVTGKQISYFFDEDPHNRVVLEKVENMIQELNNIKKIFN